MTKKTKIVATIGPATESEAMLTKLVLAGLNVMRLNFSHGDFAEHQGKVDNFRKVIKKTGQPLAILQDLSGPKIRIGEFEEGRVKLVKGKFITIATGPKFVGTVDRVWVNYPTLHKELKVSGRVLLDDGKKELKVVSIKGKEIKCKVVVGGDTKGRRGMNLPGAYLKTSSITEKDIKDLEFGIKNKVDYIALSFVRRPEDVIELKEILAKRKSKALVISKIETEEAIENLDEIIEVSDGIMVARGDLAIEIPAEKVPHLQKRMIDACNALGKPAITATQMLESMINTPVPTRAEVSDVANAILDGTDAVMLSEETTLGDFPLEAVELMTRVALEIENNDYPHRLAMNDDRTGDVDIVDSVTGHAVNITHDIGAQAIVALTESGFTARMLSRYKPSEMIYAFTPNEQVYNQLALTYGCSPVLIGRENDIEKVMKLAKQFIIKRKIAKKGENVVITAGAPFSKKDTKTNMVIVETI
jgi:pyruvate kinase